jgi:hypothetical protein
MEVIMRVRDNTLQDIDSPELLLDEELQVFLADNGISEIPVDMASDIGAHLMEYIMGSAERLVKILQRRGE